MVILVPTSLLYAQDPGDEEGEVFWGGDEEEDEEYEEEDDEYLDDEIKCIITKVRQFKK